MTEPIFWMKRTDALAIAGSLTETSKMPCPSYSLPARACKVGMMLNAIPGTICNKCYGLKAHYVYPQVKAAQQKRLESIYDPQWVDAMVVLIGHEPHFRWHDCGDIQSIEHLDRICEVCTRTPATQYWMPTREKLMVEQYMQKWPIPDNLTIRMSAVYFDSKAPRIQGITTTSGSHDKHPPIGFACPAPTQEGKCGECRACWDKTVPHISYKKH